PGLRARSSLEYRQSGKFAALEELERGAPAGREVAQTVAEARLAHGSQAVTAADDRVRVQVGDSGRDIHGARGELRDLEDSHGAVPEDRLGALKRCPERVACRWADVEAHEVLGYPVGGVH